MRDTSKSGEKPTVSLKKPPALEHTSRESVIFHPELLVLDIQGAGFPHFFAQLMQSADRITQKKP